MQEKEEVIPKEEVVLDQAKVNQLVADARKSGKATAEADLLKALGLESTDALKAALTEHRALKTEKMSDSDKAAQALKDAQAVGTAETERANKATLKLKESELKIAVINTASKLGIDPNRAAQIVKLLEIDPASFDPEKPEEVETAFNTFLALPGNEHFKGDAVVVAKVGGGKRTGPDTTRVPEKKDKFSELTDMITAVRK